MLIRKNTLIKIALFGGPGKSKTTTAHAVVAHFKSKGRNWVHVPEYARAFFDNYGAKGREESQSNPLMQLVFLEKQIRLEKAVPSVAEGFITDSPTFFSFVYCTKFAANPTLSSYIACKNTYKGFFKSLAQYDYILECTQSKEHIMDGTRIETKEDSDRIHNQIKTLLEMHGVKIITLPKTIEERVSFIDTLVTAHVNGNSKK